MRILSCEEGQVVYLSGKQTKQGLFLRDYVEVPFSPDLAGTERLEAALRVLVQRCRLKGKKVLFLLPSQGALFRELYLPKVKRQKQLESSILNEMLYFHTNIEEYTVTYLESDYINELGQLGYFVYALRNAEIEEMLQICQKLRIKCEGMTIQPDALARFTALCYPEDSLSVLIDINETSIDIALVEEGCCVLSRQVGLRYQAFREDFSIFAAELADQVNRILQFQQTRHSEETLQKVFLLGDFPEIDEVVTQLQQELKTIRPTDFQCLRFDMPPEVRVSSRIPEGARLRAAGALLGRD